MTKGIRTLLMLLAMVFCVAGSAFAQGTPPGNQEAAPVDTARQAYENGAIIVSVKALTPIIGADGTPLPKNYGYRIGDIVTFEVQFVVNPNINLNLEGLIKGQFDPVNGTDYLVAGAPKSGEFEQDGKKIVVVIIQVRTWVMKPSVTFNSVFLYATDNNVDGTPNFKPAMAPDYMITYSRTAGDAAKSLDQGDTSLKVPPSVTVSQPMRYTAYGFILIVMGALALMLVRWMFPPKVPSAAQVAWKRLSELQAASGEGMSYANAVATAATLRKFFSVQSVTDENEMKFELARFFEKSDQRYELARVGTEAFAILEKALYEPTEDQAKVALTPAQTRELFAHIERLVPRP